MARRRHAVPAPAAVPVASRDTQRARRTPDLSCGPVPVAPSIQGKPLHVSHDLSELTAAPRRPRQAGSTPSIPDNWRDRPSHGAGPSSRTGTMSSRPPVAQNRLFEQQSPRPWHRARLLNGSTSIHGADPLQTTTLSPAACTTLPNDSNRPCRRIRFEQRQCPWHEIGLLNGRAFTRARIPTSERSHGHLWQEFVFLNGRTSSNGRKSGF